MNVHPSHFYSSYHCDTYFHLLSDNIRNKQRINKDDLFRQQSPVPASHMAGPPEQSHYRPETETSNRLCHWRGEEGVDPWGPMTGGPLTGEPTTGGGSDGGQ